MESYWREVVELNVMKEYYFQYIHHSRHRIIAINVICLIASCTSTAAWLTNYLPPLASGLIVLFSQFISVLQPIYPFSDRLCVANRTYTKICELTHFAEDEMYRMLYEDADKKDILSSLKKLHSQIVEIERDWDAPNLFPYNLRLRKIAETHANQYLKTHFDLGEYGHE